MRIAFVTPLEGIHGGVRNIVEMANYLKRKGHDVFLVADHNTTPYNIEVPIVTEVEGELDVAIATWWPTCGAVQNSRAKKKGYLVQHDESICLDEGTAAKVNETYKMPWDFCITIAPWLKDFLKDFEQYNTVMFTPFVDYTHFKDWGNKDAKTVLYFSRPLERKRYREGMFALKIIKEQRPDIKIVTFDTDPLPEEFTFVDKHVIAPQGETLGRLYSEATVYMQATPIEGFGTLSLEAIACGTAVVTPDRGGTATFGEYLIQYVESNALEIAEKCIYLIDNPDVRGQLEKVGLERVKTIPSWESDMEKVDKFLCEL